MTERWLRAWNDHDVDAIVEWYAEDGSHRMASGNTYVGPVAIRGMVERSLTAYPDLSFSVRDSFTAGSQFAIEYTMHSTRGQPIAIDGVLVGTTNGDGRVVTCVDYLDHLDLRRQMGLTE